jgi:hypothetical protein
MKLFPPQPNIELYRNGFDGRDLLDRKRVGAYLSDLIERVEDPLVIAIDGQWGSGKSFFLKCWVGAHKNENAGTATTVYFDAFENDFLDDPLISLTSAVSQRIASVGKSPKAWDKARRAAATMWRPSARVALSVATAGISEIVGAVADAGLAKAQQEAEKHVDALWKREAGHKAAMIDFKQALQDLTAPSADGQATKLVIAVDELDRCRPDYALTVLETIKHFFNVQNVHFILGANMDELSNSVRARYGQGTRADLYLQKFISITLNLPNSVGEQHEQRHVAIGYFDNMAKIMEINESLKEKLKKHLIRQSIDFNLTLRAAEKVLTQAALVPQSDNAFSNLYQGYQWLVSGIVIMKSLFPEAYRDLSAGALNIDKARKIFSTGGSVNKDNDYPGFLINHVWTTFLAPSQVKSDERWGDFFGRMGGVDNPERMLKKIMIDYFEILK